MRRVGIVERKKTIGLLMDYVIPGVIDGAGAYVREHGLRIDARWSVRADWMPESPGWDGVLAHLVDSEGVLGRVGSLGLPVVHLSGWLAGSVPRVDTDYRACAALAVGEFRELGLRRVAGVDSRVSRVGRRSFLGLRVAARRAGLEFVTIPRWPRGEDFPDGVRWVAERLAAGKRPCGLFLPHAGFTFSVLDELAALGVRVPEDVAVIVIDKDVQRTAALAPVPLTAVVPDDWHQGYEAARMVHRLMDGKRIGKRIVRIAPVGIVRRNSTGVETTHDPVVAKALHWIRERPLGRLSVRQLANYAGVSRRTLEQRFRRETGRTLHAAIMRRRVDEAKRLLRAGDLTVAEVAEAAGYSSVHYFSTAFKREIGETPGRWRRAAGENRESAKSGSPDETP
jgi:LacI family transcriptional regulator